MYECRGDDKVYVVAAFYNLADIAADEYSVGVDICLAEVYGVVFFLAQNRDGLFFAYPPVYAAVFLFEQYFDDCGSPTAAS